MRSIDKIRWQTRVGPARAALSVPGRARDVVSYTVLERLIDDLAGRLAGTGMRQGDTVGLLVSDSLLHIATMLALEDLGAVTASLTSETPPTGLRLDAVVTDQAATKVSCPAIRIGPDWLEGDGRRAPDAGNAARSSVSAVCRIMLTSGTTGAAKAVALTHDMIAQRLNSYTYVFGPDFACHARMLCCFGMASSLGYLFCIHVLTRGGMFCIPESSVGRTLRKIERYEIETMAASSATLAEIWAAAQVDDASAAPLQLVLTAGSLLPPALADGVRRSICSRLVNFYGTTETGVVASAPVEMLDLETGAAGYVVPGVEVETTGGPHEGRVRIRGPANAKGYLGGGKEGAAFFEGEWFYPGDLGHLSQDGLLSIRGRESNVVNLGGTKTTLETIEMNFAGLPLVKDAAVLLAPDALGIDRVIVFIVPGEGWLKEEFESHYRKEVSRDFWPIKIVTAAAIPRSPSGKVDRHGLSSLL